MIAFQNPGIDVSILVFCFLTIIKIFLIFFSNSPFYFKSVSTFQIIISNFKIYNKKKSLVDGFSIFNTYELVKDSFKFCQDLRFLSTVKSAVMTANQLVYSKHTSATEYHSNIS